MRTIREIYDAYKIMPNLAMHQLRVAAIGQYICQRFQKPIDENVVIQTGLLHDMGNILKSDFDKFPDMFQELKEKGIPYWKQVQTEFREKFGTDEHHATIAVAHEIGVAPKVIATMDGIGFHNFRTIIAGDAFELKIAEYCDGRVGPHGVLSLSERLNDSKVRYTERLERQGINVEKHYQELTQGFLELEKQLTDSGDFDPAEITDAAVAPLIEKLWDYTIV